MQLVIRAACWPYNQTKAVCRQTRDKMRYAYSLMTVDNFKELARKTLLLVSKIFKGMGLAAGFPFFALQHIIAIPTRRPTKYTIGNEAYAISGEQLLRELRKLEMPARKIERLELLRPTGTSLAVNGEALESLRNLLPQEIVIKNGALPPEILRGLETSTKYYSRSGDGEPYKLKNKIIHLVLPRNMDAALAMADDLVDRCERAVNVYFYGTMGRNDELIEALRPLGGLSLMELYRAPADADALLPLLNLHA